MSDEALMREAERCRRLARESTDRGLAATLEAIACEFEARSFSPFAQEPVSADAAPPPLSA